MSGFFNEPPRAEQVHTGSALQQKGEKAVYPYLEEGLSRPRIEDLLASSGGMSEFLKNFLTPLDPTLEKMQGELAGLSLDGPLDDSIIKWLGEMMNWDPSITSEAAQKAITENVETPGYRALETQFIPAMSDMLAMQGGAGSSRRAQLTGDAYLDFAQTVAGERATTERDIMFRNLDAEFQANQLRAQIAPFAMGIPDLKAGRIANRMEMSFPFQNRIETAATRAMQAYSNPAPGVSDMLTYMGIPQTSTNWWQPMSGWDITKDIAGFGTTMASAAGEAALAGGAQAGGTASMAAAFSDVRLKKNIKYITTGLPVNVATWDWNDKAEKFGCHGSDIGFIAQDVLKVWPHLVTQVNGFLCIFKDLVWKEVM